MPESRVQHTPEQATGVSNGDLRSLYANHRWFDLRDALDKLNAPAFYRGAVACVFDDRERCRREFVSILQASPDAAEVSAAGELLIWMCMRRGEFRQALSYANKVAEIEHDHIRWAGLLDLLRRLGRYPEQRKAGDGPSILPYEMIDGNMFIPVLANGKGANFMVDSGASLSLIAESEARRLGLTTADDFPGTIQIYGATGAVADIRLAVANDLRVGRCHLKNVTFAVLQDGQLDFPGGYNGALGLPVLLALETLCWDTKGSIELSFPSPATSSAANICFDNGDLIVETRFQNRNLNLVLDTGNGATVLWPPFARECPHVVDGMEKRAPCRIYGVSGDEAIENLVVRDFRLAIGNCEVALDSVNVLMRRTTPNSDWLAGRLGMDLMKAGRVTLDFKSMTLTLE